MKSPDPAMGVVDEAGIPATASAVTSTVFAATGTRARLLPLRKDNRVQWNILPSGPGDPALLEQTSNRK